MRPNTFATATSYGKRIDMPDVRGANVTYKRAPEAKRKVAEQQLDLGDDAE